MSEQTPSRLEQIRALLGTGQRPATDELLLSLAESVRDRREHERMGAVLARLADAEAKAGLLGEKLEELDAEVRRYAAGEEAPVLWSVYDAMHQRAVSAEYEADRLRAELTARQGGTA
ncbi:hypothetical protein ACFV5N_09375 [Streptomyces sp. NPDC059853]|uniref:hypothetical protein n=1 Tax=Streptomyces sp. NPDC059853 TaxID=3346973 RepID=UPI00365FEDA8